MEKYLIVALFAFGLLLSGCTTQEPQAETPVVEEPEAPVETPAGEEPLLGGDRDEHGCIPSAGYVWCEPLQECIRPWETECPEVAPAEEGPEAPVEVPEEEEPMPGSDVDEHGCIGSAGYVWCEPLQECIRPWETECPATIDELVDFFCAKENVSGVHVCGDHIIVMSSLIGGGSTIYDATGNLVAQCPVVGPDSMSDECKHFLIESNCLEEAVC